MESDTFFQTIVMLIVPVVVAALIEASEGYGFLWPKVNQPTVAGIVGGLLGLGYHVSPVYTYFHAAPPAGTAAEFITAGIIAGLGGSGLRAIIKDAHSGAMGVNSEAGIERIRKTNEPGEPRP